MFRLLKFLGLCVLAVCAGIVSVSFPVQGKTPAEHVRGLIEGAHGSPSPVPGKPASRSAAPAPAAKAKAGGDRSPADSTTAEEKAALDELIGGKARR